MPAAERWPVTRRAASVAAGRRATRPAPRLAAERRRVEIELRRAESARTSPKPTRLELARERRRVADQHDRQLIRLEELPRDALDVRRRHAPSTRSTVGLDLRQVQAVEQMRQHLLGDRGRRFDREREIAGEESPARPGAPRGARSRAAVGRTRPPSAAATRRCRTMRVSVSATTSPLVLVGVELGRRAVGQAALGAQHAEQPVGAFAAEDADRHVEAGRSRDASAGIAR